MTLQQFYIDCPHCGTWHIEHDDAAMGFMPFSGSWSDGRWNVPLEGFNFLRCDKCNNFFWTDESSSISMNQLYEFMDREGNFAVPVDAKPLPEAEKKRIVSLIEAERNDSIYNSSLNAFPNIPDLFEKAEDGPHLIVQAELEHNLAALQQLDVSTPEREAYIRTRIWHCLNDLIREKYGNHMRFGNQIVNFFRNPKQFLHTKKIFRKEYRQAKAFYKSQQSLFENNLHRLLELVDDDEKRMEMHRELGQFRKARQIYNKTARGIFFSRFSLRLILGVKHVYET